MNKFEQLIEYVINNEESKARELFHEIVVEKSRVIYEEMMQEEEDEDLDEAKEEELDEAKDEDEDEELDENVLGGDQADDLIDDVETEEEGMTMEDDAEFDDEAEEAGHDVTKDIEGEEDLEDRVVDLEDKLDELMAEFEALMGDEAGEEHVDGEELDDVSADDFGGDETAGEEMIDTEYETEGMFNENVSLKAAPAPVKSEDGNINKKSTVAANSGARGAMAKPVHTGASEGGHHDSSAYKNTTKELIGKVGNTPAQSTQKPTPATKPQLGQAAGVNNKSVIK